MSVPGQRCVLALPFCPGLIPSVGGGRCSAVGPVAAPGCRRCQGWGCGCCLRCVWESSRGCAENWYLLGTGGRIPIADVPGGPCFSCCLLASLRAQPPACPERLFCPA